MSSTVSAYLAGSHPYWHFEYGPAGAAVRVLAGATPWGVFEAWARELLRNDELREAADAIARLLPYDGGSLYVACNPLFTFLGERVGVPCDW